MRRLIVRTLGLAALGFAASLPASAQFTWDGECIDPGTMNPYSNDYAVTGLLSELMGVAMGVSGSVTYGDSGDPDDNVPCFADTQTINVIGRFGFFIGSEGSVQDQFPTDPNSQFTDDFMAMTYGAPQSPGGSSCYASTSVDGTRTRFGEGGVNLLFTGESNRYFRCTSSNDGVNIDLTVSVIGDAVQFKWDLRNDNAEAAGIGLWFGAGLAMLASAPDNNGAHMSHFSQVTNNFGPADAKLGYVVLSTGGRPPVTEHRYRRQVNPGGFPQVVDFLFGQTAAFGLRVENGPTPATMNASGQSDASEATEFVLGQRFFLMGTLQDDNNFSDVIFPPIDPNDPDLGSDVGYLHGTGFIQKFPEVQVAPGTTRRIVHYFRSTWGTSNYTAPYAAVVDAPRLIAEDVQGGPGSANGLRPNPLRLRVYVDNVGGYATINQEIDIQDVRVTLTLPPGLSLAPGEQAIKFIGSVPARQIRFVDYNVIADGIAFGELPYSVKIEPTPGPVKTLNGTIRIASTPRLNVEVDANLITLPWTFQDTSYSQIFAPLNIPGDLQIFAWDPQQQGYIPATSAERGVGHWIVSNADYNSIQLAGNPQRPADTASGGKTIQLKSGWNLIGNPYNYAIRVGELVGVAAAAPEQSYTWTQLVSQGFVSGALAYYDNALGDYVFTVGNDAFLEPNRGYWIFVGTLQDVTISFPAVFAPFVPGSTRSDETRWVQNDKQWRLQLVARTGDSLDAQNFLGQARNAAEATRLKILEPPITPVHDVQMAIEESVNGQPKQFAQTLSDKAGRKEWRLTVSTTKAGSVHLTWPNISTVPQKVRFRITDLSTGTSRDLRQISGYTFEAGVNETRNFKVEAIPGGVSPVVIGSVVVNRADSRSISAPFSINYTLSSAATTTIRILSASGKEVFSVARGRADSAGENSAVWALRDNANRLVAPGTYRVEIIAETGTGERVRRVVPVNVVR
jgi:hypothetical protein